jgi:hypothetical protein
MFDKIKHWWTVLPDKKKYIEFFTALLTVPVLLTVLISNINSLKTNQKTAIAPTPTPGQITPPVITIIQKENPTSTPTPTPNVTPTPGQCNSAVGPVNITSPADNEVVNTNPVCINISYNQGNYCAVVWSYRINGGSWSDFTDKSICLYNLPPGTENLELQVKSVASSNEVLLNRTFTVSGTAATPTPTQTQSQSATSSATAQ